MAEMSLVLFTVLSQLTAGAVVTLWILDFANKGISVQTGKFITGSLFGITALSIVFSLFHLGHPLAAFRAFANIGSSWLSREVILFSLFSVVLAVYYLQWEQGKSAQRKQIGLLASAIAIVAVISSGMVYVLPAVPAWNNFSPVVFFLLTAALLGPLFVGSIIMLKESRSFNLPLILFYVIGIYAISFVVYLSVLISSGATLTLTGLNILNSYAFWFRVVLSWIIPSGMFLLIVYRKQNYSLNYIAIAFVAAIIGEILGRELFYSAVVALQVGAF
jgi:anaerobic dimethyl sulfoxide reductase subunit C (anchor subunit)